MRRARAPRARAPRQRCCRRARAPACWLRRGRCTPTAALAALAAIARLCVALRAATAPALASAVLGSAGAVALPQLLALAALQALARTPLLPMLVPAVAAVALAPGALALLLPLTGELRRNASCLHSAPCAAARTAHPLVFAAIVGTTRTSSKTCSWHARTLHADAAVSRHGAHLTWRGRWSAISPVTMHLAIQFCILVRETTQRYKFCTSCTRNDASTLCA